MFKLIAIILAAVPVVLFLRSIFAGPLRRSPAVRRAVSDFKRQVDYVVWAILVLMACGTVYSIAKLIMS
ncbi:MAG TPA: hypothetical protein VK281_15115 [Xanthobacteraceae bacterium]|nr:hypothetical protein [Xanthobacteraceae bacterium]